MNQKTRDALFNYYKSVFIRTSAFNYTYGNPLFYDNKIINETDLIIEKYDNKLAFSKYMVGFLKERLLLDGTKSDNCIYSKIYWLNSEKKTLTLTIERYDFTNFKTISAMYGFLYELFDKYNKISEEAGFYVLVDGYLAGTNLLCKAFIDYLDDPNQLRVYDKDIIRSYNKYRKNNTLLKLLTNNK